MESFKSESIIDFFDTYKTDQDCLKYLATIKYRRKVLSEDVSQMLNDVCLEISTRYEIHFLEIGCDEDHVHFLIQSVQLLSPKKIANTIKSLIAREVFRFHPEGKRFLWNRNLETND